MKKFVITSDSSCDLTKSMVDELDVKCAHLSYTIDNQVFHDDMIEEHINEFYRKMENGAVPKTSQIPPSEFESFFTESLSEKLPVLHISLSSSLSGTYRSACLAADEICENNPDAYIKVLDSSVGSAGLAMLILEAVKYRDAGRSIEETAARLEAIKENINICITTDDLTYMRRGGRISASAAMVSSVLSISPFITLSRAGKLYVCNKVRGSKQVLQKFCSFVSDTVLKPEQQTLYIVHSNALAKAKAFGETLKNRLGFKRIKYLQFGTTIGSHAGPGLVSAFYFGKLRPIHI